MIEEVKTLPKERLHYVVIQQNKSHRNLSLNELKKFIKRGIRLYIRDFLGPKYKPGLENEMIKYYCFFETTKEFQLSQRYQELNNDGIYMGLHFHLFLSSGYGMVHIPNLIYNIFDELTSLTLKRQSINLFDYKRINQLDDKFIQYHTKQFYWCDNSEMILKNI